MTRIEDGREGRETQDPLSVIFHVSSLIAGSPAAYFPGAVIRCEVRATGQSAPATFKVEGYESLAVVGRPMQVLKVVGDSGSGRTELWLAPELGYVPVRMRFSAASGQSSDLQWTGK